MSLVCAGQENFWPFSLPESFVGCLELVTTNALPTLLAVAAARHIRTSRCLAEELPHSSRQTTVSTRLKSATAKSWAVCLHRPTFYGDSISSSPSCWAEAGPAVSLQGAAPAVRTYPLHLVLPCMHQPNFWSIRQNDCFLGLVRREVQLPPSLSSTAPCSSPVHLRKDRLATSPLHDMDCSTMLYSQLGSEPHSAIYSTNMWKTLTLCWENTRKTTESSQVITNVQTVDTNGQIPGKKSMFKSLFTMSFSATAYL